MGTAVHHHYRPAHTGARRALDRLAALVAIGLVAASAGLLSELNHEAAAQERAVLTAQGVPQAG